MSAKVQLVLPGLFDLPVEALEPGLLDDELPHLNRVLRLATPVSNQAHSIDSILRTALALNSPAQSTQTGLPMAQAFARADDRHPERLLLSQAIHLQTDLHSAVIVPISNDRDNLKDINIIINDLSELFNVDCDIDAIADGVFLVRLKAFAAPNHYPHILSVLGKTANPYIEQSRQILPWYILLNEIQMFMHQHEINQQRFQRGLLTINSLWCWGAGSLPTEFDANLAWFCDDPILNRFGASLGLNPRPCGSIAGVDKWGHSLIIDLRLMEWLKTGSAAELDRLLLDIDRNLIKPILSSLAKGTHLVLRAGYELDFELRRGARMKFWRRHKSLASWTANAHDP